jgi:hypothetical protein
VVASKVAVKNAKKRQKTQHHQTQLVEWGPKSGRNACLRKVGDPYYLTTPSMGGPDLPLSELHTSMRLIHSLAWAFTVVCLCCGCAFTKLQK